MLSRTLRLCLVALIVYLFQSHVPGVAAAMPHQATRTPSDHSDSRQYVLAIQILPPRKGVDFEPYLKDLYTSIRRHWIDKVRESTAKEEKGVVTLTLEILQDGTMPKEFPKIARSSGKKDLDDLALAAVSAAVPFGHLPEAFAGPSIEVRLTFYYALPQPAKS